jgi:hypothetical protein
MADVSLIECDVCGMVTFSFQRERILEEAESHKQTFPDHQLFLHVMESKESREL